MNKEFFNDAKILITGGTGSLGKAIIKYLKHTQNGRMEENNSLK